jgi:predicted porin
MKKSLIALAVLAASGTAFAQSSVTIWGVVDASVGSVKANGKTATGMSTSGLSSNQIGFRGTEDLGGGLKANFWLEGALTPDNGTAAGLNFARRSVLTVSGGFGEVRLGRDYTPSFWNATVYDPFGTNGVGAANTAGMLAAIGATPTTTGTGGNAVRANNSIAYVAPAMGAFQLNVMAAFGEQASPLKTGNYMGFRAGYVAGPISAHYGYGKTEGATDAADTKYSNFGGAYDLGVARLMALRLEEKTTSGAKITGTLIGATVPMGAGMIRAAVSSYDVANSKDDWKKTSIGYVHNLSKRTAAYATYARVNNSGNQIASVNGNTLTMAPATAFGSSAAGGNSTGYEFGVRHSF